MHYRGRQIDHCASCGEIIDVSEWHPTKARTTDGETEIYSFCSERCRNQWTGR
ncbi:DUF7576 family protein [Haloferax mediterranei]